MVTSRRSESERLESFLESWLCHSINAIPIFVVVPDEDRGFVAEICGDRAEVLPEGLFAADLVSAAISGKDSDRINQGIIRLMFGRMQFAEHYLCATCDVRILRDFALSDFFARSGVPYQFESERSERRVDPSYGKLFETGRAVSASIVDRVLGVERVRVAVPANPLTLSSVVVESLGEFMRTKGIGYGDLLSANPDIGEWYSSWFEYCQLIPRVSREPIIKDLDIRCDGVALALSGASLADLARSYIGVVGREDLPTCVNAPLVPTARHSVIADRVSVPVLIRAVYFRLLRRAPRVVRVINAIPGISIATER
jgi:hypothetical protein